MIGSKILSRDAGQRQSQLPVSPVIVRGDHSHFTAGLDADILLFTSSTVFSTLHEALYYKIGFVLDEFDQLYWSNVLAGVLI